MKYPASKHYAHLDPSEPIPQIEPRCNEYIRIGYEAFSKVGVWILLGVIGAHVAIYALTPSYLTARVIGLAVSMLILGVAVAFIVRAQRQSGLKRGSAKHDPWGIPMRLQMRYYITFLIFMWVMQGGLDFRDGLLSGLFMLGFMISFTGLLLIIMPRFARQPGQISCERCDYPLVGLTLPSGCPECGHAILDLSYATDRPKIRDNRYLAAGIILVVFGGVTLYVQFVRPTWLYTPIPRPMLVQLAARDRDAFARLMSTHLDAADEQALLNAMVANRVGFEYGSSFEQEQWFGAQIDAGGLTRQQLDALCEQFTQCNILAPQQARIGEPLRLQLVVDDHERAPSGLSPMFYFEGFRIDDDPTLHAQSSRAMYRNFLDTPEDEERANRGSVPVHEWTPQRPGMHTIQARLVFVISSTANSSIPIDWSQPESQRFPRPHVWSREVVLEHTLTVTD